MTQIKLLVIMPVPEDQQDDDTSRDATFTGDVNAILRFDGGWRLTMSGADYPGATAESTEMAGDADDPPVKEAITSLAQAAVAEPEPDEDAAGDGDAEGITVNTQAEVLQFEVPEGSDTVQVRVEPEVFVKDGEQHVRVKVNDPAWVKETSSSGEGKPRSSAAKDAGSSEDKDAGPSQKDTGSPKDKDASPSQKDTDSPKDKDASPSQKDTDSSEEKKASSSRAKEASSSE